MSGLHVESVDDTLVITIDNGDANLFTGEMTEALAEAVEDAEGTDLRFIRLRAAGPVFCTGRERNARSPLELQAEAARIVRANEALRNTPLTVLAEVHGDAAGFGTGLVAGSDIAVASEDARFWWPEILGGLAPSIVISWFAKLVPHKVAFDLVTSGDSIDAEAARRMGLVTEVVPKARVEQATNDRIKRLADMNAAAIREIKQFFIRIRSLDPATAAIASVEALALSAVRNQSGAP